MTPVLDLAKFIEKSATHSPVETHVWRSESMTSPDASILPPKRKKLEKKMKMYFFSHHLILIFLLPSLSSSDSNSLKRKKFFYFATPDDRWGWSSGSTRPPPSSSLFIRNEMMLLFLWYCKVDSFIPVLSVFFNEQNGQFSVIIFHFQHHHLFLSHFRSCMGSSHSI